MSILNDFFPLINTLKQDIVFYCVDLNYFYGFADIIIVRSGIFRLITISIWFSN